MASAVLGPFHWTTPITDLFSLAGFFSYGHTTWYSLESCSFVDLYIFAFMYLWLLENSKEGIFSRASLRCLKWSKSIRNWEVLVFVKGENPGGKPSVKGRKPTTNPIPLLNSFGGLAGRSEPLNIFVCYINVYFSYSNRSIWKSWPNP